MDATQEQLQSDILNTFRSNGKPVTHKDALDHEMQMRIRGHERYVANDAKKELSNSDAGSSMKQQLISGVQARIEEQIDDQAKLKSSRSSWYKHIVKINTHDLADMTLTVVLDGVSKEWTQRKLHQALGRSFVVQLFAAVMSKTAPGRRLIKRLDKRIITRTQDGERRQKMVWRKAKEWGFALDDWTDKELVKIGSVLLNAVELGTNLIKAELLKRDKDSYNTWYILFTDEAQQILREHRDLLAEFSPWLSPMILPPRDWNLDNVGPYLTPELSLLVPAVRNVSPEQKAIIEGKKLNGDINAAFEALNFLQAVPYEINAYVVEAVEWATQNIEVARKLKHFPSTERVAVPERLSTAEFKALSPEEQIDTAREYQEARTDDDNAKAAEVTINRRIEAAQDMLKFEKFWLPHNFDYRGRVYHVPDFGHHHTDFTRAMFLFANKKPVGNGERYFCIQLANTFGHDKWSKDRRVAWALENSDAICAAGNDFRANFDFWSQADDPFQFLAACHEWANYKRVGPEYHTGLPVGLDATQSGIQHYAAASLHPGDGPKVNLAESQDSDEPADLYAACLVEAKDLNEKKLREMEAELAANPWSEKDQAKLQAHQAEMAVPTPNDKEKADKLDKAKKKKRDAFKRTVTYRKDKLRRNIKAANDLIALGDEYDRGVIKRNALTYAYSSREFGFAEQLRKDWMREYSKEVRAGTRDVHPFGDDRGHHAAFYIAEIHKAAIDKVVSSAAGGMEFLRQVAEILAEDTGTEDAPREGTHFAFENSMGFPMFQYYRTSSSKSHKVFGVDRKTMEYNKKTHSYYRKFNDKVDKKKAMNGVAPNVIHSQDGAHLLMTALACKDAGLTNMMVIHDSFATTIADSAALDTLLRKQFVDLYRGDHYCLFDDVLWQAKQRHSDPDSVEWPKIPDKGDKKGVLLDLKKGVMGSKYFFS